MGFGTRQRSPVEQDQCLHLVPSSAHIHAFVSDDFGDSIQPAWSCLNL